MRCNSPSLIDKTYLLQEISIAHDTKATEPLLVMDNLYFVDYVVNITNKLESSIHQLVNQMQDNSLSEDGNHVELNSRVEKVKNNKKKSQHEHSLDKRNVLILFT
jgi:hypothetical protein